MKLSLQAFWVALRKESVDRNLLFLFFLLFFGIVALRKESVDRNGFLRGLPKEHLVALRKESVDRNAIIAQTSTKIIGRSPQGERG